MPKFILVGKVTREVEETVEAVIVADDHEEAADMMYEILSEFPNSPLVCERLLVTSRIGKEPDDISFEFAIPDEEDEDEYDPA